MAERDKSGKCNNGSAMPETLGDRPDFEEWAQEIVSAVNERREKAEGTGSEAEHVGKPADGETRWPRIRHRNPVQRQIPQSGG
jgi:hypothetical protein